MTGAAGIAAPRGTRSGDCARPRDRLRWRRLGPLGALAAWLGLGAPAWAAQAPVGERDFAYARALEVDADAALYALTLPADVYQTAVHPDLADLRVFNGRGQVVPHTLVQPAAVAPAPQPVPFFPLHGEALQRAGAVHVTTDVQGRILDVGSPAAAGAPRGYLIDLVSLAQPLAGLRLDWAPASTPVAALIEVQASEDLVHWYPLTHVAPLLAQRAGTQWLRHDSLELDAAAVPYLRLSWPAELDGVRLTGVHAIPAPARGPAQWLRPGLVERAPGVYEFDNEGSFPIAAARVRLAPGTVAIAVLSSRPARGQPWQVRQRQPLYALAHAQHLAQAADLPLPLLTDRHWRLELAPLQGEAQDAPVMAMRWLAHQLIFAAHGDGPFKLAYGSHRVDWSGADAGLLAPRSGAAPLIKAAGLGPGFALAGPRSLEPPGEGMPGTALAAALAVGGAAVLAFALRRQR